MGKRHMACMDVHRLLSFRAGFVIAVFMLILMPTTTTSHAPGCPEDRDPMVPWVVYQGFCYTSNYGYQTFSIDQAITACDSFGANITSVHSKEENLFIWTLLKNDTIKPMDSWLGLTRLSPSEVWGWMDNTPMSYTNWDPKTVNSTELNTCATLDVNNGGLWNPMACNCCSFDVVCKRKQEHGRTTAATISSTIADTTLTPTTGTITLPTSTTPYNGSLTVGASIAIYVTVAFVCVVVVSILVYLIVIKKSYIRLRYRRFSTADTTTQDV